MGRGRGTIYFFTYIWWFGAGGLEQLLGDVEAAYLASLTETEKVSAEEFLRRAHSGAEETWSRIFGGGSGVAPVIPRVIAEGAVPSMSDDLQEDGNEAVFGGRRGRTTPVHLQKELSALRDRSRLRGLEASLEAQGHWTQLDRVKELRHAEVSHKWLSHLDTRNCGVLAAADFFVNVQKRQVAISHASALACRHCGEQLDPQAEHSEICSVAEATKGHYAWVRALVNGLRLADPAVTTEPCGLTSSTSNCLHCGSHVFCKNMACVSSKHLHCSGKSPIAHLTVKTSIDLNNRRR